MTEKNIALIINYPIKDQVKKGNFDIIHVILNNLLNRFDKVYVISLKDNSKQQNYVSLELDERIIIKPIRGFGNKAPVNSILSVNYELYNVYEYLKDKNIVVIRAFATLMSGYIATNIAKRLEIPSVVSVHVDQELVEKGEKYLGLVRNVSLEFEKMVLKRATMIPVISEYIRDYVKKLGVNDERAYIHPNFTYDDIFKPLKKVVLHKKIICVCRLERWKYPHMILEAMPKILVEHPNATLYFAGKGSMEDEMKKRTKELGIEDKVFFLGEIDHLKELPNIEAGCDLFACGIAGFALIEAMSCGLPIIVGDYEWAKEVVTDGMNGYLIKHISNSEEYAFKINYLFSHPEEIKRMSETNRFVAMKRFSKEAFEERELKIYDEVLNVKIL